MCMLPHASSEDVGASEWFLGAAHPAALQEAHDIEESCPLSMHGGKRGVTQVFLEVEMEIPVVNFNEKPTIQSCKDSRSTGVGKCLRDDKGCVRALGMTQ